MSDWCSNLFEQSKANIDWYELLGGMSFSEYFEFTDYTFYRLDTDSRSEIARLRDLFIAFARKDYEMARFVKGLTPEQREASLEASDSYFHLGRSLYSEDRKIALDVARASEFEHGEKYGWPNPLFDIFDSRPVFRDI